MSNSYASSVWAMAPKSLALDEAFVEGLAPVGSRQVESKSFQSMPSL